MHAAKGMRALQHIHIHLQGSEQQVETRMHGRTLDDSKQVDEQDDVAKDVNPALLETK